MPKAKPNTTEMRLVNKLANPQRIGSTVVQPRGQYALTEADIANEALMAKLAHAEKLGLIEWL